MSSIPTKQIDGDVSVGRDVNIGGKTTIRGSVKVGHNLTIEGWLEAKNIKGPNKGLFKTAAQLREAYPNPHKGWWALVTIEGSVASDHLGQLYVVDGGTWVAQVDSNGNPLLRGNPTVDSTKYFDAYIETLKPWLGGTLGSFDSSEAFNNYLDGLTYNSLKSGRYVAYLGGVPFFVTFSVLYAKEQISVVWVEGSLMVSGNVISSNTGKGVTICYRYYKNGAWGTWKTIYDELNGAVTSQGSRISTLEGKMPSVQTSVYGTNKNYIYSTNERESTYTVLSGKIWMHTHTDRNLFLRFKNWGAENDTDATNYNQVLLCYLVNKNQDGLMDKYVFARILNHNLAEGQSTTDKVIVNYTNFADSGNKQLELTKATTAKAGVMSVADKTYIETLKPWLRGSLGNFASSEAFNNYLDGLSYDTLKSGRYVAYLGGVPFFVTFSVLYAKEQISAIWVEGSLMVTDNVISSNTGKGVTICYRYYKNGAWETWKTIYDDLNGVVASQGSRISTLEGKMPSVQTSANGTTKNYIYSASGDEMHTALSSKIWTYTHGDGNLFLRFKHWGASNDTSESNYSQVMVANAWIGGNGVLRRDVYRRLDDFSLREENSTADAVNIVTPIFTTGGTRSFPISKATTAKAGVMTAAQVTSLNKASEDVKALNDSLQGFQEDFTEFKNTKGHSNGLAPLDETGKVPSKYLPENVLEFSGMVSGITPQTVSLNKYSSDENCSVVYSKDREVFMLKYEQPSTSPFLPATITYYNNWIDGDLFGELSADADGRVPHSCKIYIDVTTNKTYYWRGITLKTIGATAQDGVQGTSENYIYSASGDEMHTVLSSKIWIYQHGDYNQFLRIKHWGANNDTSESNYSQVQLPNAWTGGTGLLKWDVYRRLDEFKLREENSTADAVNIVTPIFTTGGTRSFPISKATTAKAGVMSVAHVNALNKASEDIQTLNDSLQGFFDSITAQAGRIVALEKKVEALEAKLK